MPKASKTKAARRGRTTVPVDDQLFKQVYDSPGSLPGRHKWVTAEGDVREIEKLLGLKAGAIGAPLWLSGDHQRCRSCKRETSWLDIVSSSLRKVHDKGMLAQIILGDRKYVNIETPESIADLFCAGCGSQIPDLQSFKCHNWAYAKGRLATIVRRLGERT